MTKTIVMLGCVVLLAASSAFARLSKDETKRLAEATAVIQELRSAPDNGSGVMSCPMLKPDADANARAYGQVPASGIALGTSRASLTPAAPFLEALRESGRLAPAGN